MTTPIRLILFLVLLLLAPVYTVAAGPTSQPVATSQPAKAFLLHFPGIAGEAPIDRTLVAGFKSGLDAQIEIRDWTEHDSGIPALHAMERNKKQAQLAAEMLTRRFHENPQQEIYLTSHSGGAGLTVWMLENLPADVKITRAIFLAPALSPGYDLSKAGQSHVTDRAYVFWSTRDQVVLSVGTKTFGTIDGLYGDAAGYKGFVAPKGHDETQYAKLTQFPYDPAWAKFDNDGDHLGPMSTSFSKAILVPLLNNSPDRIRESKETDHVK